MLCVTDLDAVKAASEVALGLSHRWMFAGEVEFLRELPDSTIVGPSFRVEFRLQQDLLSPDLEVPRTMVAVRFFATDATVPAVKCPSRRWTPAPQSDPWTVFVRGDWQQRKRFAVTGQLSIRRMRKAFAPRRRVVSDRFPNLPQSDDLHITPKTSLDDVTAQLVLFVMQTEMVRHEDGSLFLCLQHYVMRTYRFRVGTDQRTDVARALIARLLKNKWWAEDARAWRKLIRKVLRAVEIPYLPGPDAEVRDRGEPRQNEGRLVEALETLDAHVPAPSSTLDWTVSHVASSSPAPSDANTFTVQQAAARLGLSKTTLYQWIDDRRVTVVYQNGRRMIEQHELSRLASKPTTAALVAHVAAVRRSTKGAARRQLARLRRTGLSDQEIMDSKDLSARSKPDVGRG